MQPSVRKTALAIVRNKGVGGGRSKEGNYLRARNSSAADRRRPKSEHGRRALSKECHARHRGGGKASGSEELNGESVHFRRPVSAEHT